MPRALTVSQSLDFAKWRFAMNAIAKQRRDLPRWWRAMSIGVAWSILLALAGCSSASISFDDEAYRGQFAAAVTPVGLSGAAGIGARERDRIQSQIVGGLDAAGIFASVTPLSSPGESNEAEVIIDPSVIDGSYGSRGLERITLRVRARRKSTGEVGLDDSYKGRESRKRGAMNEIIKDLARDLKRKFGQQPVY